MTKYIYNAFISYSHHDMAAANKLHKYLEKYKVPSKFRKGKNNPKRFKIFIDKMELTTGILEEELCEKLKQSEFLIVVCSKNSATNVNVGSEIKYFRSLGREKYIIPFIIEGNFPSDGNRCYNPQLTRDNLNILGINVNEQPQFCDFLKFDMALMRVISKMMHNDSFDELWHRRFRYLLSCWICSIVMILVVFGIIIKLYNLTKPFDMNIGIQTSNKNLPINVMNNDRVYLKMEEGDVRTTTINNLYTLVTFQNLPNSQKGKKAKIYGDIYGFEQLDTTINLDENIDIKLKRIPDTFGYINYKILDFESFLPLSGAEFDFGFIKKETDNDGLLQLNIPLNLQKKEYPVKIRYRGKFMVVKYGNKGNIIKPSIRNDTASIFIGVE